ncbi:hypothetical protein DPEC_G00121550 [Dallia pectoralis]|uniref:Uncharacterized protein n=1 Tax=Dallia pectoralis TaxID=75939 RepID=A0ACC2GQ45_DALPE|nr:hypothetical protein DPEC_G00121550 [Dallia pectoralis]
MTSVRPSDAQSFGPAPLAIRARGICRLSEPCARSSLGLPIGLTGCHSSVPLRKHHRSLGQSGSGDNENSHKPSRLYGSRGPWLCRLTEPRTDMQIRWITPMKPARVTTRGRRDNGATLR